jgi:Tfp pilus assembly protein PilF
MTLLMFAAGCSTTPHREPPGDPAMDAGYMKIMAAMQAGDYARAIPALESRVAAGPEDSDAQVNLAIAYRENGEPEKALKILEQAVKHSPGHAAAQHQLGIVHRQLGHFDEALTAYRKAIRIDGDYGLAHRNLGILYDIYLQQPEAALAQYQRYLELGGGDDKEVIGWVADLKRRISATQAKAR